MAKRRTSSRRGVKRAKRPTRLTPARAMEAALAGIAHDIRTPLTGIVALAELLAASDLGTRERGWAEAIKSGADHLTQVATLIVDAVRADTKGLVLRDMTFSPRSLAEAVGEALAARAGNKTLTTETSIGDVPSFVSGDVVRLRAALENLADNAVKFTREGRIAFSVTSAKAARGHVKLTFTFADTGIGLSPAELKRLFKPFSQANEDVARRYGGAGLGLVFVQRIARAMGGDLTVKSKPGKGSAFAFTAIVKPAEAVGPAPDGHKGERALSILCVEDNPYGRVVMNTILRELGHRADFAESGAAAVTSASRGRYDAVLMDLTLPDFDGFEAARRIRALPGPAGRVAIIALSGHSDDARVKAAREAGMAEFLSKPVGPRRLSEMLARVAQASD